jgi:hypothetical protein
MVMMEQANKALIRGAAYAILAATAAFASFQVFLTLSITVNVVVLSILRRHVPVG